MNTDTPGGRLTAASALVAAMRRGLAESPDADLSPLLTAVESACNAIATLAPIEARDLLPRVIALLDDIEALERELDALRKSAGGTLDGLARSRRAQAAYGAPPRRRP